jgi:hypothetical protein
MSRPPRNRRLSITTQVVQATLDGEDVESSRKTSASTYQEARAGVYNCVFNGKSFGRLEGTTKFLLLVITFVSLVCIILETVIDPTLPEDDWERTLAFYQAVEWLFVGVMLIEFFLRVAVMDFVPGFYELALVTEVSVRRVTGDRSFEGWAYLCCRCGPCLELSQRQVGACVVCQRGVCCPCYTLCRPILCPSVVTVVCCRSLGHTFDKVCCSGTHKHGLALERSCCGDPPPLSEAEAAAVLLATLPDPAEPSTPVSGRPVPQNRGEGDEKGQRRGRESFWQALRAKDGTSARPDGRERFKNGIFLLDAPIVGGAGLDVGAHEDGAGSPANPFTELSADPRTQAWSNYPSHHLPGVHCCHGACFCCWMGRLRSQARARLVGMLAYKARGAIVPSAAPAAITIVAPNLRKRILQAAAVQTARRRPSVHPPVTLADARQPKARQPFAPESPTENDSPPALDLSDPGRWIAGANSDSDRQDSKASKLSEGPREPERAPPPPSRFLGGAGTTVRTRRASHGSIAPAPPPAQRADSAAAANEVLRRWRTSLPQSPEIVNKLSSDSTCCWFCHCCLVCCGMRRGAADGDSESEGGDDNSDSAHGRNGTASNHKKRWLSISGLLLGATDSRASTVNIRVPVALARAIDQDRSERRLGCCSSTGERLSSRRSQHEGEGQVVPSWPEFASPGSPEHLHPEIGAPHPKVSFVVPFGPILRPPGEVFVPTVADKNLLICGSTIARLFYIFFAPGFLLDAFLFVPAVIQLTGAIDIFTPGVGNLWVMWIRVMRMCRSLKLLRYTPGCRPLWVVVKAKREALMSSLTICFVVALMLVCFIYMVERGHPRNQFENLLSALWYGVVTVATVGYGDIVPLTSTGRLLGGILTITGSLVYGLPPAIVATGYLEHRETDRRAKVNAFDKLFDRKRLLALRDGLFRLRRRAKWAKTSQLARLRGLLPELAGGSGAESAMMGDGAGSATSFEGSTVMPPPAKRASEGGSSHLPGERVVESARDLFSTSSGNVGAPFRRLSASGGTTGNASSLEDALLRRPDSGNVTGAAPDGTLLHFSPRDVSQSQRALGTPGPVAAAAKQLLLRCRGDVASAMRALVDAERWALTSEALVDEDSEPLTRLVRLQTRTRASFLDVRAPDGSASVPTNSQELDSDRAHIA